MGGRSGTSLPRPTVAGSDNSPGSTGAGGDGGGVPIDPCPTKLNASVAGPVQGITVGTWLDLLLDTSSPRRVTLVDQVSGQTVGALKGVPNLSILMECLARGVIYRGYVTAVSGGRIDVAIIRQ